MTASRSQLLVTFLAICTITNAFEMYNSKRAPLGTMRFGKRSEINSYEDFYPQIKRSEFNEETERSIRAPLGTMRFGKRTPLGTMRFGKRNGPLSTMRFGKRSPHFVQFEK